jgi:hypothetical protein
VSLSEAWDLYDRILSDPRVTLVQEQEPEDVEVHWRARLEPVASSASGHERMINSWAAASGENGLDFPQESSIR